MAKKLLAKTRAALASARIKVVKKWRNRKKSKPSVVSAARVSKAPQIDHHGLSYAGQHLLLLIQHDVDNQRIKVSDKENVTWDFLIQQNSDVDLLSRKNHIKELCNIHHFSHYELDEIASRVVKFVKVFQPQNVK